MTVNEFKGKLTAILGADVKGYSRLMSEDEAATVRTLKTVGRLFIGDILVARSIPYAALNNISLRTG